MRCIIEFTWEFVDCENNEDPLLLFAAIQFPSATPERLVLASLGISQTHQSNEMPGSRRAPQDRSCQPSPQQPSCQVGRNATRLWAIW